MIRIDTHIDDDLPAVDTARLRDAIHWVLRRHRVTQAEISLAVIGDLQMHALNLQHLQHDYPTDVLSFVYAEGETLEGEVIVSVALPEHMSWTGALSHDNTDFSQVCGPFSERVFLSQTQKLITVLNIARACLC